MASGIEVEGTVNQESSGSSDQSPQNVSRSRLVQRLLAAGSDLPAFVRDLLTTQAVVVAGTEAAGFLIETVAPMEAELEGEEGAPKALPAPQELRLKVIEHVRPDNSAPEVRQQALQAFAEIVKPCIIQNKDGAIEIGAGGTDTVEPQFCLVTLLRSEGKVVAVSAVITRCRGLEFAQQRLTSMQLVAGYFELFTLRRGTELARDQAAKHQYVLQLATAVSTAEGFASSAMNLANELATRTSAARVSVGWLKGTKIKLVSISHSEEFDRKQELSVQLERVMEECYDNGELVQFDPTGEGSANVTREAQALSRMNGGGVVLSLPLHHDSEVHGVITLEFPPGRQIDPRAATALAVAAELIAPQLYDRYQNDRWLITKTGISIRETAKLAVGPKHMLPKLLIVVGIIAVIVLSGIIPFTRPMFHVTASFTFAPIDKRTLSAPYDGYISKVYFTAGEHVNAGDVLLEMDTTDLVIEKAKAEAQAASDLAEAQKYLNDETKRADYRQKMKDRDVALNDVKLYQSRIDRATLKAPFTGVVLSGDWRDKIGAPLKQGDTLFDMSEHGLRAELVVADRDIQWLHEGGTQQTGMLATTALPDDRRKFTIERIFPLGEAKETENVYKVWGRLDNPNPHWHPGAEGEAKIDVEPRAMAWIWTHRLMDFVMLKFWQYR